MRAVDATLACLKRAGVNAIFGLPGGPVIPLFDALFDDPDIRTILPRHEQGGGFMAEGYARSTGKVGVCMATSGPGATNFVTAIADAKHGLASRSSPSPARSAPRHRHRRLPGDADRRGLPRPITKHHYLVTDAERHARA